MFSEISMVCTSRMASGLEDSSTLAAGTSVGRAVGCLVGWIVGGRVGTGVTLSGLREYSYCTRQASVLGPAMPSTVSFSLRL